MIAKKYRLSKKQDFKDIFAQGKTSHSCFFIAKILDSKEQNPQFALVVSGKITKKAVVRNRLRRQIYEIIRHRLPYFANKKVIIICKKESLGAKYNELEKELILVLAGIT